MLRGDARCPQCRRVGPGLLRQPFEVERSVAFRVLPQGARLAIGCEEERHAAERRQKRAACTCARVVLIPGSRETLDAAGTEVDPVLIRQGIAGLPVALAQPIEEARAGLEARQALKPDECFEEPQRDL